MYRFSSLAEGLAGIVLNLARGDRRHHDGGRFSPLGPLGIGLVT